MDNSTANSGTVNSNKSPTTEHIRDNYYGTSNHRDIRVCVQMIP